MQKISQLVLAISAIVVLCYPLWGVIAPESYAIELSLHHAHADTYTLDQVRSAASLLWISNSVLAGAFFAMLVFLRTPRNSRVGVIGGSLLVLYPIVRTVTEVLIAQTMMASSVSAEFSSEKLVYIVFGLVIIALSKQWPRGDQTR